MPWNPELGLAAERADFVESLLCRDCSFSQACRHFGISRKTGYKWLGRATQDQPQPLRDRSRRPLHHPNRTPEAVERTILAVHDDYSWGARKIHAFLHQRGQAVPCPSAVHKVLRRHGRTAAAAAAAVPAVRFERRTPNHLWQMDFKGPLAGAPRHRYLLTVEDDHSRYLLAVALVADQTMASVWAALWPLFGSAGLPVAILSDNGFAPRGPAAGGLSWLEARLLRLGIQALHGRPYHPQTQGKVERAHQTMGRELLPRLDWARPEAEVVQQVECWRAEVYNAIRPHEALGNATPASRWYRSERRRPEQLPAVVYPAGMPTRKVMQRGEISWQGYELMVGAGLEGERIGVEARPAEVALHYAGRVLRRVPTAAFTKGRIV
jgi:transposase InsO family protein